MLAATALGWAVVGLVLGLMSVLPTPNVGFPAVVVLDSLAMLVEGYSLWLAAFALLGLALALLARRVGFRRTSLVAAVLGVVTLALCLVPVVQGWRTASQEGVALSLSEYFSLPIAEGSPETVTYARPEGEELKLDVWAARRTKARPVGRSEDRRWSWCTAEVGSREAVAKRPSGASGSPRRVTWSSPSTTGLGSGLSGWTPPAT